MSKVLSRVRALVSEIDAIQTQGQKKTISVPPMRPLSTSDANASISPETNKVISMTEAAPAPVAPVEGKVFIQLTGKIAVQLQLEHTDEMVEVRQRGETIEIRFMDGKAIHLPLRNVA